MRPMVQLTRLNHSPFYLNADLIETIETTPDTVISLTTAQKVVVLEEAQEVVRRVLKFRRELLRGQGNTLGVLDGESGN